jgi:MFS family permease
VLQAIGGAMLSPVAMSIVRNVFEDPRERAQAIGVFAAMFGISMALGPVLGGFLVSAISWRSVFLVNLPIGPAAIALTALFVPDSRAPRPRRIDPVGQVLVIAALTTLTYAIIEGGRVGFGALLVVILPALALGASPRWCSTSCAVVSRCSRCASSPARRSPAPARSPYACPRPSAASCS